MKTLYIADLDGTLFSNDAVLTQNTISILNKLISQGLMFTIATARSIASVSDLMAGLNLSLPVSLMNGVFCYDLQTKKALKFHHISDEDFKAAIRIFDKHKLSPFSYIYSNDGLEVQFTKLNNQASQTFFELRRSYYYKNFSQVSNLHIPQNAKSVYFNAVDTHKNLKPLSEDFKKIEGLQTTIYNDTYTDASYLEVFSKNAGKDAGAKDLKALCNADKVIVFGDNHNDIPMFEAADESYAMENAINELKDMATATIGRNTEDGVANFILKHFKNNNKFKG